MAEGNHEHRRHYAALDGLRGFAAVSVVIFHIGHWLDMPEFAPNASLAVDLFFCLSGFVLSLAYGNRLGKNLSSFNFLRLRLIRLMPLIVLATVISAVYVAFKVYIKHEDFTISLIGIAITLGLLNLPYFGASKIIGGPQLFPLNGPQFTLFLELFVNIVWSLSRKLNTFKVSVAIALVCFFLLLFGIGGDTGETFWKGFPRVGASFFIGVAIFHLDRWVSQKHFGAFVFWGLAVLMVALFYFPKPLPMFFQLAWIGCLSPLLVLSGSRMKLSKPLGRIALLGGEISYAVYSLQYPIFCWVNGAYQMGGRPQNAIIEAPFILGAILIGSYIALKLYDKPLRRYLSQELFVPKKKV